MLVVDVFGEPFTETFAPGTVPPAWPYSATFNGVPFELDLKDRFLYETLQSLREAQDTGTEPGEGSLATQAAWIRKGTDWSGGAGQEFFDAGTTDRTRFWRSEGVANDWPGEMRLARLQTTLAGPKDLSCDSAAVTDHTGTKVIALGWDTGAELVHATVLSHAGGILVQDSSVALAGTEAATVHSLWGLGGHYLAILSNGWRTHPLDVTPVAFAGTHAVANVTRASGVAVGTRLLLHTWDGNPAGPSVIQEYNPLTGATVGTAVVDGATAGLYGYDGVAAASSATHLYLAFVRGDQSQIWRVGVETGTGTDLVAAPATPSPFFGEEITDIEIESNVMVITTTRGVRIGELGPDGNLATGPLLERWPCGRVALTAGYAYVTTGDVHAGVESLPVTPGIVRADLSRFVAQAALVPSWIVVATDPAISRWSVPVVVGTELTWTRTGGWGHLDADLAMPPASRGWFDTGWIDYGLSYPKMLSDVEIVWKPRLVKAGSVETRIRYEDADTGWRLVATTTLEPGTDSARIVLPEVRPRRFALRFDVVSVPDEADPVLRSWAVRGMPIVPRNTEVVLPVICKPEVSRHPLTGRQLFVATAEIITFFDRFIDSGEVVTMGLGPNRYRVRVNGQRYQASQHKGPDDLFGGITNVSVLTL